MKKFTKWLMAYLKKIESKIQQIPHVIMPGAYSRESFDFLKSGGSGMMGKANFREQIKTSFYLMPKITRSIIGNIVAAKSIKLNPRKPRLRADPNFIVSMEHQLKNWGVDIVGYTKLNNNYIFSHTAIMYENVIMLAQEMDKEQIQRAPSFDTQNMVQGVYADLGGTANKLAFFLRKKGYGAQASHALRGTVIFPPLAQLANMGMVGRNGVLLTEKFGPRVRLAAVFTSIENLPFANSKENPYGWLRDFCDMCGRCIRECPPKALFYKPIVREDGSLTHVDNSKCHPYFEEHDGCAICIKECPFSDHNFISLKKAFLRNHRKAQKKRKIP